MAMLMPALHLYNEHVRIFFEGRDWVKRFMLASSPPGFLLFFLFFFALSCILSWRVFTAGSLGRRTWCATSLGKLSQGRRRNLQSFPHVVPDTTTQRVFFLSSFNSLPANNREQIKGGKRNPESYKHWTVCAFCCAGGLYRSRNSVCAACCLGLKKKKKRLCKSAASWEERTRTEGQEMLLLHSGLVASFIIFLFPS